MEQLRVYRESSNRINWKPSPIVSLATSIDGSQVAAAREDGSLEIWLVSPGSVGWHCQLRIHGNTSPKSRITSLVWCYSGSKSTPCGRLLSSSTDGTISEWDFFNLEQKIVLDINGVSIWQMATEPFDESILSRQHDSQHAVNGYRNDNSTGQNYHETSDSEDGDDEDDDSVNLHLQSIFQNQRVAVGCDDGSVRLCNISDADGVTYKLLSKVDGRVLSVAWSHDARQIFSGSSDGFIRCWDAELGHEVYRITVGLGGLGNGRSVCTWSLLSLRCGTLVSADSSGSVQFWNSKHGSRLQAHSYHKGDVYALAASPSHTRVFSAGSDGQVILYKCSVGASSEENSPEEATKWVYVSCVRAHTHDIMALTVAVPICREELVAAPLLGKRKKRTRQHEKPLDFSYHKWAHLGVPMLISGGDDTKLFAYSIREFTKFSPHDICPAPQRVPIQLAPSTNVDGVPLLLVQCSNWLDIFYVHINSGAIPYRGSQKNATTKLLTRIESEASRKIICSTMSNTGVLFAYSDNVKPSLFQLKRSRKNGWAVYERELPRALPFAHSMVFSSDSSRLMISSQDRKIYVVDVETAELLHMFTPCRKDVDGNLPSRDPPITKMFTSLDGQWLAAVNCFGDIYIFNLETERQHWFISRLNGSSVTAGGFPPGNNNVLIVTTSSNHVYAFDVEAKQLGEWSREHTFVLPRRFQEFPGEVIGLSFSPVSGSTSIIVYSARAMCLIDFGMPVNRDDDDKLTNGHVSPPTNKKLMRKQRNNKNFDFCDFRDPVLFVSHTSENSVLVVDKPWMEVMKTFVAPVHRHVYGRS